MERDQTQKREYELCLPLQNKPGLAGHSQEGPHPHWAPLGDGEKGDVELAKTKPGADCGSDHGLLIAKLTLK